MDEIQVFALIAEGENAQIEFKRELDLTVARSKAEFIKDVIALANTAIDVGYMLIGVDNDKMIVGVKGVKEEQVQQILSTYITPPVIVTCETVSISSVGFSSVAILEIRPTRKPHSVARAIEQLQQNRVFVRHGKVVAEASPDEITLMYEHLQALTETRQYIRAAETHERLGYLEMAITAYSKAIELAPTAELFLARGNMYERCSREATDEDKRYEMEQDAFRDFSDAVKLANTPETKKTTRLRRWCLNPSLISKEDYALERDWLVSNTSGRELGKVLFSELYAADSLHEVVEAVACLNQVIELGYGEPEVYELRAAAHCYDCNYGLALKDVDKAIMSTPKKDTRTQAQRLMFRASILIRMEDWPRQSMNQHFVDAYDDLVKAYEINGPTKGETIYYFDDEIFYKAILGHVHEKLHRMTHPYWMDRLRRQLIRDVVRAAPHFISEPKFAAILRELLGEDLWNEYLSKTQNYIIRP